MTNKNKSRLRDTFKTIRAETLDETKELIVENVYQTLIKHIQQQKSNECFIGIYWPLAGEIDLRRFKDLGLKVALPGANMKRKELSYHPWTEQPLKKDFCGIPSPLEEPKLSPANIQILFVPALAIDKEGYRLGYGGGFFDRLRANPQWRSIPSFVVIPSSCISKTLLPKDPWDIPFDGWITEKGFEN